MTKLKKIYYPILAVVFAIALVLGFVSSYASFGAKADRSFVDSVRVHAEVMEVVHNSYESENQSNVRTYIKDTLVAAGIYNAGGNKNNGYESAAIDEEDKQPLYVLQEVTLNEDTFNAIKSDDELFYAIKDLVNVVVVIPGKSEETVMFTANYDTAAKSQSGTESIQAAAMLQTVLDVASDYQNGSIPQKTLLFVFTDAEHEGALGAYAFRYQFKGFNEIVDKIELAINFGAVGTGALSVSSDKISVNEVVANASGLADAITETTSEVSDYDVMDVAKINVFFGGSKEYINTSRDTIQNVSDSKIAAIGGAMSSLVSAYGFGDAIKESSSDGTFSYVGLTFSYSDVTSYVLGGVAALLLVLAVVVLVRKGKKLSEFFRGVLAQLMTIAISAVLLFACYFVLALMLAGFGVVPINALFTITYSNAGLLIGCLILAFAAYVGSFLLVRSLYSVRPTDVVRGGAVLLMVAGIAMSFAMPSASMLFAIVAILEGVALILSALFADKFKSKTEKSIERLFPYALPVVLLTPAIISAMVSVTSVLAAIYLPLVLIATMLGFGVIAPYFGSLKPALVNAFEKLPKHSVRVEKVVTERVEGAKRGRYTEVTSKKVVTEKVAWKYRNRYGVAILALLAAFIIVMFAVCPTHNFSTNIVDSYSYREAVKDDSVVYCWKQESTSSAVETLRVYDQVAYSFFGRVNNDYSFNPSIGAYEKTFTGSSSSLGTVSPIGISLSGKSLAFTAFDTASDSLIDLRLTNVSSVTKITLKTLRSEIEIENDGNSTIRFQFPYDDNDYGTFTIEFESEKSFSVGVDYTQYVSGERTVQRMKTISEYTEIVSALKDTDYAQDISCGMIFNRINTYSIG